MLGHEVTVAHDGPGALAAAAADAPDLVLLDIGLPGMDGYAVAARCARPGLNGAALVAVTGYGRRRTPPLGRGGLHPSPRQTRRRRPAAEGRRRGQRPVAGATRSELISAFRSIQPSLKRKLEWNRAGAPSSA